MCLCSAENGNLNLGSSGFINNIKHLCLNINLCPKVFFLSVCIYAHMMNVPFIVNQQQKLVDN